MNNSLRIKLAEALGWEECKEDEEAIYCDDVTEPGYVTSRTLRGVKSGYHYRQNLPDFTRFDSGAALLVEHLADEGWMVAVRFDCVDEVWRCELDHFGSHREVTEIADTLPLAIVAAAQKVLNIP